MNRDRFDADLRALLAPERVQANAPLAGSRRSAWAGRPTGWSTSRSATELTAVVNLAARQRRAGHGARRRIERARRRRRRPRRRRAAAAHGNLAAGARRACAPTRASRSTAWCAGRSAAGWPDSRRGRARRARSAARSTATRTTAAEHRRSRDARAGSSRRRATLIDGRGRRHGVRVRHEPAAADAARLSCGRSSR